MSITTKKTTRAEWELAPPHEVAQGPHLIVGWTGAETQTPPQSLWTEAEEARLRFNLTDDQALLVYVVRPGWGRRFHGWLDADGTLRRSS